MASKKNKIQIYLSKCDDLELEPRLAFPLQYLPLSSRCEHKLKIFLSRLSNYFFPARDLLLEAKIEKASFRLHTFE